ncbi:MAG: 4-hydroxy-tetrahydrodipicolinate synthase [Bacteroidetes bacterium]|jgi:4-hydroxy-tetrahydrodipicolinate synthase|nr:4-hydroxy-tetrahydrodipicolinate synthase [Bacteroidota bacterium]MBT6685323.1 4-hydroxy-tetrahydrodipicolinate synthase [Bacteroidota bacterium]MBT7142881.1 4-hydroxy-tetrahydrodipicolinate synthase [Bacteroidota bacterium]MBT7490362.1 4-hydroxy-tetrahydrodipicolinate synthase [Bacteroidota bacterium]
MDTAKFKGTGVALVTPFDFNKNIDFDSLGKLIDYQLLNNIDYFVVLGTTGESVTLSKEEKKLLVEFVIEKVDGRKPIVVGIGGNNTDEVLKNIYEFDFQGIDTILSVAPYYNKPNQKGLYEHYSKIAEICPVPIILYNVPGRTGANMDYRTCLRLARDFENIIAVKEASGDILQIMNIIKEKPRDFMVISGDDALTLPLIVIGVEGVISVTANAFPQVFVKMMENSLKGNFYTARKCHYDMINIIDTLFSEGSPAGIKATLSILEISQNYLRLPLTPVSRTTYLKLQEQVERLKQRQAVVF